MNKFALNFKYLIFQKHCLMQFSLLNASLWTKKNQTIKKYFKQLKRKNKLNKREKKKNRLEKKSKNLGSIKQVHFCSKFK